MSPQGNNNSIFKEGFEQHIVNKAEGHKSNNEKETSYWIAVH